MSTLGYLLLFIGTFSLIAFLFLRHRSGRMATTPFVKTGDAASRGDSLANAKKALSVEGQVRCASPEESPVTRTPCLYYELRVTAKWKSGDNETSVTIRDEKTAASFSLDDGSGPVAVDASKGGDFELKESFKKTQSRGLIATFKDSGIVFGPHGFSITPGGKFKGMTIPETADYEVVEKVLAPPARLYAIGKFDNGRLVSPDWVSLLLTSKSREEALADTLKKLNLTKYLAAGGIGVGAVFAVLGAVFAPAEPATPAEAPAIEQQASAPADAAPTEATPAEAPAEAPAEPASPQ